MEIKFDENGNMTTGWITILEQRGIINADGSHTVIETKGSLREGIEKMVKAVNDMADADKAVEDVVNIIRK